MGGLGYHLQEQAIELFRFFYLNYSTWNPLKVGVSEEALNRAWALGNGVLGNEYYKSIRDLENAGLMRRSIIPGSNKTFIGFTDLGIDTIDKIITIH